MISNNCISLKGKKIHWAYGREERRHRKKYEKWAPQERILETSNDDKERRRKVMAGKHQEPTWKDTKEEQRERKR